MQASSHVKLLINLARADGKITDRERKYILNIARANGMPDSQIEALFEQQHEVLIPAGLDDEKKFDCIYSLVQLMKIDELVYREEIKYCSSIAGKLGYDRQVLFELMLQVRADMKTAEKDELRKTAIRFLKK